MVSKRVLNRTLLDRQFLLDRVDRSPLWMTEHLVGLQAQVTLPPYVGLWSRLRDFDPAALTGLIESRQLVRIVVMRGTIHLLSAADCLELRPLTQEVLTRTLQGADFGKRVHGLPLDELAATAHEILSGNVLGNKELGLTLADRFPEHRPGDLANTARVLLPLVQVPPRGLWKRSGGPTYALAPDWLGAPLSTRPDFAEVVRRYLRTFGPATAADINTWCGRTGVAATLEELDDELVRYQDESGRTLFDLAGLSLADPDLPAPVRLLGQYDNVFLSHKDRSRVFDDAYRSSWMGANGVAGAAVLVDGFLEGLWRVVDGRVVTDMFRELTKVEQRDVDAEVSGLEAFLAR